MQNKFIRVKTVHAILAHSYLLYLVLFLIGVYLDMKFDFKVFPDAVMVPIGVCILALASLLILWAQKTSRCG